MARLLASLLLAAAVLLLAGCGTDRKNPVSSPSPSADTTPPVIVSGPTVSGFVPGAATITWATDEPSNSVLIYSTDSNFHNTTGHLSVALATEHTIQIGDPNPEHYGGLGAGTYYYQVRSTNAADLSSDWHSGTFVQP